MKILLFFLLFSPCSVDETVRLPAAINICARSLILRYSTLASDYNSLPIPVHVRHFLQLQGARPPPEPYPIRNYKLCRLAAMILQCETDVGYFNVGNCELGLTVAEDIATCETELGLTIAGYCNVRD